MQLINLKPCGYYQCVIQSTKAMSARARTAFSNMRDNGCYGLTLGTASRTPQAICRRVSEGEAVWNSMPSC